MKKLLLLLLPLFAAVSSFAQDTENLPADYLTKEFHAGRREALRQLMPHNAVAVIFAYPERVFSQDINYKYHQNPDLYYLSGYKEPNSVLFIFKDPQTGSNNETYNELFFIQQRDSAAEIWTGKRLGVDKVKSQLGFTMVFNGSQFKSFPIDFSKFDKILFESLPATAEDDPSDSADLHDLVQVFKEKVGVAQFADENDNRFLNSFSRYVTITNLPYFKEYLQKRMAAGNTSAGHVLTGGLTVQDILSIKDSTELRAVKEKIDARRLDTYGNYMASLRQIKTPEELVLLKKSVDISSIAHAEVMKAIQPGMSERDLQAIFEFVHKEYGAEEEGYPPIVGAGSNGCTLHYEENAKVNYGTDMVLMDVASEYHGYAADVTRTVPSTGKFTTEQKAIYDLVYQAQEAVFKLCKEGSNFDTTEKTAKQVLTDGLMQLGIIKSKDEIDTYYPHGCSHFIGLDVHDNGIYKTFMANMAITVEPGIYIPQNSACDKKWWGIAVRIEDDILITKNGYELLSDLAPRKSAEVEKMVAQKSVLNNYKLPELR
jgi:Xaa-Pro aminopeptidase